MKKTKLLPVSIFALILFTSCPNQEEEFKGGVTFDKNEFAFHRERWNEYGAADYTIVQEVAGGALPPGGYKARVIVFKKHTITGIVRSEDEGFEGFSTIDGSFETIEKYYNDAVSEINRGAKLLCTINVVYDQEFHYPVTISHNHEYWNKPGSYRNTETITEYSPYNQPAQKGA